MTTMGVRLKKIREALHLKQSELGAVFDCSYAFISAVENDKSKLSVENLIKLLVKYDVNINYVLAGKGEMFNSEKSAQPSKQDKKELAKLIKETVTDMILEKGGQELFDKIFKKS